MLFLLLNHPVLFFRESCCCVAVVVVDICVCIDIGDIGRLLEENSEELAVRRPRKRRTDEGRFEGAGLVEFVRDDDWFPSVDFSSALATESTPPLERASLGKAPLRGVVGCEERGPRPVADERASSGGVSGGGGMSVPSVREKLMGVTSSNWSL